MPNPRNSFQYSIIVDLPSDYSILIVDVTWLLLQLTNLSLSFYGGIIIDDGFGEDGLENNIQTSQALSGLKVTIDYKLEDGNFQTRGVGKLDEKGQFKLNLPQEILEDGMLSGECYVQLHNAANAPCAFYNGLEASKITFVSKSNKYTPLDRLENSNSLPAICSSATLWGS
ncbi:proline-rich protein 4-like [Helianthus annuus]|uniref:proline-rich protein 4-like n=1 Tax=Helianthus annuus TaxID=4232 RepID=UPI001652FFA8|nr:proline-rich protein 4-like [Helianthus annuus]